MADETSERKESKIFIYGASDEVILILNARIEEELAKHKKSKARMLKAAPIRSKTHKTV